MNEYVFHHDNPSEPYRLELLQQYVDPITIGALARISIQPGWRCADLGAGRGSIAKWMTERAGPTGLVKAVDTDIRYLSAAPGLEICNQDALLFASSNADLDLVHLRFLLVHMNDRDRSALLSSTRQLLRPGGHLLVVESDYNWWISQTLGDPLLDRVRDAYITAALGAGWDLELGSKIPRMLEDLDFDSVRAEGIAHYDRAGSAMCQLLAESVLALTDRIVRTGIATEAEVASFYRELMYGSRGYPFITTWATTATTPP